MDPFDDLKQRCAVIADLNAAGGLLRWDQETHMPPGGAEPRSARNHAVIDPLKQEPE